MPVKSLAKRTSSRSQITRAKLLAAARTVFVRDGFSEAAIEEIASLAGYSRGAFYANFESKEDVFFELLRQELESRIAMLQAALAKAGPGEAERAAVIRDFAIKMCSDSDWGLLNLEFRLYGVRRPKLRRQLTRFIDETRSLWEPTMLTVAQHLPFSHRLTSSYFISFAMGITLERFYNADLEGSIEDVTAYFYDQSRQPGKNPDSVTEEKAKPQSQI